MGSDDDPAVPFLRVDEAAEVRRLAQQAFAAAGVEVSVQPDHFAASDGQVYGLWNLAAMCHSAPDGRRTWPTIITRHVHSLLEPKPSLESLSVTEILERTVLRVYGRGALPCDPQELTYGRELADDLVEALVLDLPKSVLLLRDEDVARLDLTVARQAGLENLLREPIDAVESFQPDRGQPALFDVVLGDSVYTASRVLAMPDLLQRVYGERVHPDGVLVAVPHRHQIVLRPLGGADAVQAVQTMAGFAKYAFSDAAGSVSPHLYWWRGDVLTRLSTVTSDGEITINASPEFAAAMDRWVAASD